jgi:hypothetical protein
VLQPRKPLPALLAAGVLALGPVSAGASTPSSPGSVRLFSPSARVTLTVHHSGEDQWVDFNPAIYLEARGSRFEVDVRRPSYSKPLQATVRIGNRVRTIPQRYLNGWLGFRRAFVLTWSTPAGARIARTTSGWCPNDGGDSRLSPQAATETAFTGMCGFHPFTRSQRWGVDRGWARQVLGYGIDTPGGLGDHTVLTVMLRKGLAQLFGIPERERTLRFDVAVKNVTDEDSGEPGPTPVPGPARHTGPTGTATSSARFAPRAPRTTSFRPPASTLPDLISLPAFGIVTRNASGRDFLDFSATVYNGGRGPLVAEGFRRGSKRVMDAYQMFYRGTKAAGSLRVGTMAYDSRPSHQHWHFEDFAKYDLVDRHQHRVRSSGKEAFCLAPTDGIDLLQPGAAVDPGNGDLGTACGDLSSIWVREVLAPGWGDTYTQARAGQSINITDLPNGTYWIRVSANPADRLHETSHANNVSLRRVILGGSKGHRTVRVPRYGVIDSEATFGGGFGGPVG